MSSPIDLTAMELKEALQARDLSSEEIVRSYLSRIETIDVTIKSYNETFPERALKKAREIDAAVEAGEVLPPLAGIPMAVKDNLCSHFGHTTCSSKILGDFKAPYDATVIARLERAGAIILGKTNMDEFAMGSSTENSCTRPTRNPWNISCVPGGSSGGSAAAVSSRQCTAALGSDTGGSIRQPAAFCGTVGLKPTYGRVSRFGLVAYGSSLDQIGTLSRDVTDCALVMQAIAGHDPMDTTSVRHDVPNYVAGIEGTVKDLTIGIPGEFLSDTLDSEIHASIDRASEVFRAAGARIITTSLPHSRVILSERSGKPSSYAIACYYIIAMAEASSNLSRYDGVHYGLRCPEKTDDIVELYSKTRALGFGSEVQKRIMIGNYALSSGYYEAYYLKALKVRRLIKSDFDEAFKKCDILLCPVTPTTAFRLGEKLDDPLSMYLQDVYTASLNLAGIPGLALPCGMSQAGLPIGMQLVGPVFSEQILLRAGRVFEKEMGILRLSPADPSPGAGSKSC